MDAFVRWMLKGRVSRHSHGTANTPIYTDVLAYLAYADIR